MENFDGKPQGIREKSVYLLHLDTPRIILIVSVIIGVIAASFLFGMNFIKKSDKLPVQGDMISSDLKAPIPDHNMTGLNDPLDMNEPHGDKKILSDREMKVGPDMKSDSDILTADNIKDIIPPEPSKKKGEARKEKILAKKKTSEYEVADTEEKPAKKKSHKVKKEKAKVQEVAVEKKSRPESASGTGFAVQVGSYDKRSKAEAEVKNLKQSKYSSYIDKTTVEGKTYYRVKVGPISSKDKALDLLNELQENPKYKASYLTKE